MHHLRSVRKNLYIILSLVIGLAANKADLYDDEQVSETEGRDFAKEINAIFKYTSSKNDSGLNELFESIANKYFEKYKDIFEERAKKRIKYILINI